MNIQDLGAIGEIVGAFAVLATLIYLTVQVRQSNRNDRATARQTIVSNYMNRSYHVCESPKTLQLLRDAHSSYDDLDVPDKHAFDLFMQFWWGNLYQALLLRSDKLLDDESFNMISNAFVASIASPGGREYWREAKKNPSIPPSLVSYLDGRLASPEGLPTSWAASHDHWSS
jgi:hypothetical protein